MQEKPWQIISDYKLWDSSLLKTKQQNFLQSSSFGQFQEKLGNKVWYFGIMGEANVQSFALAIKIKSRLGSFLYIPWGPLVSNKNELQELLKQLKMLAIEEKAIFVRLEPRVEISNWERLDLKVVNDFIQPQCTLVLDLTKSEDDLRRGLNESTRYNIGWVERQGVVVEESSREEDFQIFEKLLTETAKRQKFLLHKEQNYYKEQFRIFVKNNQAKLFIAKAPENLGGVPLSAAVVIYFGDSVTYLHAASSSQHPKLRTPYLMQWKIIQDAKKSGATKYDFWGIAATDNPNEPWAGVTAFKKSFGGERFCYPKPYDLIVSNKYSFVHTIEKLRPLTKLLRW